MLPKWQPGIVKRIENVNATTRRFFIELPESDHFDFIPGQFVTLDLPIHEQRNKRWRSYSIASLPDGGKLIELVVVLLEGGAGSGYLFNDVAVGSVLTLRGPQGVFVLPEQRDHPLYFICTGTGIAPFRSMLLYIEKHQLNHDEIHLVFGTRTQADLLYRDELEALALRLPKFYYHPTLSREHWEGHHGYVHEVYERLCQGQTTAQFMLCGWKVMIDEAKERLLALGYDKKQIHLELYG